MLIQVSVINTLPPQAASNGSFVSDSLVLFWHTQASWLKNFMRQGKTMTPLHIRSIPPWHTALPTWLYWDPAHNPAGERIDCYLVWFFFFNYICITFNNIPALFPVSALSHSPTY